MNLHVKDLTVTHRGRTLVDVPELELQPRRPVTIVGESGSGKSLLAHTIMGTLPPELTARGSLLIDGQVLDIADMANRRRLWGRTLALLPQEPVLALDPTMRVGGQVAEGFPGFPARRREARSAAGTLLKALGLGASAQAYPHTLSGGMAQRAAFAAATIGQASVLIADEPSKGLDVGARDELAALLGRHVEVGGILLTITHDLELARQLGGEVLVMRDATVVEHGPAGQVLAEPSHSYTQRLIAAEPSHWTYPWMDRTAPAAEAPRLVSGRGLAKSFGGRTLFSDLSVAVRAGERLAISGPSGCGKTTLGNILLRLTAPDVGQVSHAAELGVGRLQKLYQDPALAFPPRATLGDGFRDLLRRHRLDPARLDELLPALRLQPELLGRLPGQVSGGELQRLAVIRAMLLEPALLFADEPTSRLDLITQEETICALMEQVDRQDCALVLVTHDESLAHAVAGRRLQLGQDTSTSRLAKTPA
ncbi:ABC transporter ATP-binding protein [Arthrobacter mobilis]|uniref:ABC transporter ATP-binding protein n=1 Tax=Arthrobacter mobilis TaxID=2724944 RepID=A0A7X6K5M3_9MICC|nr:ATP-binding cassette domain-containing protein [Arthrobacter mobilis]NKX54429.1 ABC transporter ATP-binding protein [Arthrobacter mobilis]